MNITIKDDAQAYVSTQVANYLEGDVLDLTPFNDLSKEDMIAHIIEVHNHMGNLRGKAFSTWGTKVTKAEMIEHHNEMHALLDMDAEFEADDYHHSRTILRRKGERWGGVVMPAYRHTHMAMPDLTQKQSDALKAAREGKRTEGVLSATERKVLGAVVDNDFGSLKQEMRAFAADTLTQVRSEINDEWDKKEKSIPDFATRATTLRRKHDEKMAKARAKWQAEKKAMEDKYQDDHRQIVHEAKQSGVDLDAKTERVSDGNDGYENRTVYTASVAGRKEALKEADAENAKMLERALMDLEKQRLTAQRQVLLSGVPQNAMTILEDIPDAKTLMVQSAKESAQNQIEAANKQS